METVKAIVTKNGPTCTALRRGGAGGAGCRRVLVEVTQLLVEARLERASAFTGRAGSLVWSTAS